MIWQRRQSFGERILPLVIGAGAVGAAAITGAVLSRRRRFFRAARAIDALEEAVVGRLLADPVLRERAIEVAGLSDGIMELSGTVRTKEEAERAVAEAQAVPAVRTVLNRIDIRMLAEHLDETRRRFQEGEPRLHETHWYGQRIGMGRRRQGRETDPARTDEKSPMLARELGTNRATDDASEPVAKAAPAVEGHTTVPGAPTDRGSASSAPRRRLGNLDAEPPGELRGESMVHRPMKKGTRVTFEERHLERALRRREREEGGAGGP